MKMSSHEPLFMHSAVSHKMIEIKKYFACSMLFCKLFIIIFVFLFILAGQLTVKHSSDRIAPSHKLSHKPDAGKRSDPISDLIRHQVALVIVVVANATLKYIVCLAAFDSL